MADYAFRVGNSTDCEVQVRHQPTASGVLHCAEACVVDVDGWCETPLAHPLDPQQRLVVVSLTEAGAVGLMLQELQSRFGTAVIEHPLPVLTTPRRVNTPVLYRPLYRPATDHRI